MSKSREDQKAVVRHKKSAVYLVTIVNEQMMKKLKLTAVVSTEGPLLGLHDLSVHSGLGVDGGGDEAAIAVETSASAAEAQPLPSKAQVC